MEGSQPSRMHIGGKYMSSLSSTWSYQGKLPPLRGWGNPSLSQVLWQEVGFGVSSGDIIGMYLCFFLVYLNFVVWNLASVLGKCIFLDYCFAYVWVISDGL